MSKFPARALLDNKYSSPISDPLPNILVSAPSSSLSISGPPSCSTADEPASTSPEPGPEVSALDAGNPRSLAQITRSEDLNWCDREEILTHSVLLDGRAQRLLRTTETKRLQFSKGFDDRYFDNLLPIILSGYERAEKIVCCKKLHGGTPLPCDQWALCSRCSSDRAVAAAKRYTGIFDKMSYYHLTLAFDGDIVFSQTTSQNSRPFWLANQHVVEHLIKTGIIQGAYISHELSIRSFLPLRVHPHSHVIVAAHEFDDEAVIAIQAMITDSPGVTLVPSIRLNQFPNKAEMDKGIRYLTKPINLQAAYQTAWNAHCEQNRQRARELNLQMKEFLDSQAAAFSGFVRSVYRGVLMPQKGRHFIGVKREKRKNKKRKSNKR